MHLKIIILSMVIFVVRPDETTVTEKNTFRNDYSYDSRTNRFYKLHKSGSTYFDAANKCAAEGTEMAVPHTELEAKVLKEKMDDVKEIWLALHDIHSKSNFTTLSGVSASNIYTNWGSAESNNSIYEEDCVRMISDGTYYVDYCFKPQSFVCTIRASDVKPDRQNSIESVTVFPDKKRAFQKDYSYDERTRIFYKLHRNVLDFFEANSKCTSEGTDMAVPLNKLEATVLKEKMENETAIWLDLNDVWYEFHFVTSSGLSTPAVYLNWYSTEPNNAGGNESCVKMVSNGAYFDDICSKAYSFICTIRNFDVDPAPPKNTTENLESSI